MLPWKHQELDIRKKCYNLQTISQYTLDDSVLAFLMYVNKTYFIFKYFTILSRFIAGYFTIPVLPPVNLFLQLALVPVLDFITNT